MTYQYGKQYPLDYTRRPLGAWIEPTWYILTTPPQREKRAEVWLERIGMSTSWMPTTTRHKPNRRGGRTAYQHKVAPGYLFAMFEREPIWDVLFMQGKGRVSGVVSKGSEPCAITEETLAKMQQVPQRIEQERQAAADAERAARLANMPEVGGNAVLEVGPLSGRHVQIEAINQGIAYFIMGSVRGEMAVDRMRKA